MTDTAVLEPGETTDDEWVDPAIKEAQDAADARAEIDPCPICGSYQDAGPQGVHWTPTHCWKCGKRPGVPTVATAAGVYPGMTPAQRAQELTELRKGIVADVLEALRGGATPDQVRVQVGEGNG